MKSFSWALSASTNKVIAPYITFQPTKTPVLPQLMRTKPLLNHQKHFKTTNNSSLEKNSIVGTHCLCFNPTRPP